MANSDKDTIYIDIDDEITGVIDKVKNSKNKVVALVLPKRAAVFQSIVNMKLLKRAADSSQKNLVLITAEAGLLPLAGSAGIYVAKTLTSKPEIPTGPEEFVDNDEPIAEDTLIPPDADELDKNQTVGELAGEKGSAAKAAAADGVETVALDNSDPEEAAADADKKAEDKSKKGAKNKKLKVPNFERFRLWIALGVLLLILIIGGFIFAAIALPKATIDIKTNATNVPTSVNLSLSTTADSLNANSGVIPAKLVNQEKTSSAQVSTTGQKNEGNKASGSVNMTAQYCGSAPSGPPQDIPAGTGLSNNNQTYITDQDTSFGQNPSYNFQSHCFTFPAQNSTPITAQNGGSAYNVSGVTFAVAGGDGQYTVNASGSASGGTDNIVQTVNQNDIDNAKSKISTSDSGVKQALETELKSAGYYPIPATYSPGTPVVSTSANVGTAANSVSVTENITYTMFGVHQSDLKTLVDNAVDAQIDTSKQSVLDEGLSSANFSVNSQGSTSASVVMSTTAIAGPQLNVSQIKQSAEGKHTGDVKSQLLSDPNVTNVTVKLSPFWVSSVPSKTSRITVNIEKPTKSS